MFSRGNDGFELTLGKLGLTLFILGVSALVFTAFQLGVMVGKDMDAYPDKALGGLPGFLKQKIVTENSEPSPAVAAKSEEAAEPEAGETEVDLTFYDTLGGKKTKVDMPSPRAASVEKAPVPETSTETVKESPPAKESKKIPEKLKEKTEKDKYFVQVVSLKDEKKADEIRKQLAKMGFRSELDMKQAGGEKLYCVRLKGFASREDAAKVLAAVEEKMKLKGIIQSK